MSASTFCAIVAVLNLAGYWFASVPEVWADAVAMMVKEGATEEQARIRLGWRRIGMLWTAVACGVVAALP